MVPYYPVVHSADGALLDDVSLASARGLDNVSAFASVTWELNGTERLGDWRPYLRLATDDAPLTVGAVAPDYFETLGVPVTGRSYRPEETRFGADPVAIVSAHLWRRVTGAPQFRQGQVLRGSQISVPVIGVVASTFAGPRLGDRYDAWISLGALPRLSDLAADPQVERLTPVTVYARLADGVDPRAAEAEVRGRLHPRASVRSLRDVAFPLRSEGALARQRALIRVLWVAAIAVTLLGCANLASLFMARVVTRRSDIAIRRALGGAPRQIVLDTIAEFAVLVLCGLAAGLCFRYWILQSTTAFEAASGLRLAALDLGMDWPTLFYGLAVSGVALLIAVAGPARQAWCVPLSAVLHEHDPGMTRSRRVFRALLVGHVAMAVTLLVAALTLVSAVRSAFAVDPGFARDRTILASVRPGLVHYANSREGSRRRLADFREAIRRLELLPEVRAVTYGSYPGMPATGTASTVMHVDGEAVPTEIVRLRGGPGYLEAAGATLTAGRDLTAGEVERAATSQAMMRYRILRRLGRDEGGPPNGGRSVAIIDQTLASVLWGRSDVVGRSLIWTQYELTYEVVGVAPALTVDPRTGRAIPTLVTPLPIDAVDATQGFPMLIGTHHGAGPVVPSVTGVLRSVFPDAPVLKVDTARRRLEVEMAQERMGARIFGWYALAACALGLLGLHGLLVLTLADARRELGIRAALGAPPRHLRLSMARAVMVPVLIGVAVGLGSWWWVSRAGEATIVGLTAVSAGPQAAAAALFVGAAAIVAVHGTTRLARRSLAESLRTL